MQHPTYGQLYDHIEKRIPADKPHICDGTFKNTRVFAKVHHINFFELKQKMMDHGATCDHEVIEKIKPRMPPTSPINTKCLCTRR